MSYRFNNSWLLAMGVLIAIVPAPGCDEDSVCKKTPDACQLVVTLKSDRQIGLGEPQSIRIEYALTQKTLEEQQRHGFTNTAISVTLQRPGTPPVLLESWQREHQMSTDPVTLDLPLSLTTQNQWSMLPPPTNWPLDLELIVTQTTRIAGSVQPLAEGRVPLKLGGGTSFLLGQPIASDPNSNWDAGIEAMGATMCSSATVQVGVLNQQIRALIPRLHSDATSCVKSWVSCGLNASSLTCNQMADSTQQPERRLDPHESLLAVASAPTAGTQPLLWLAPRAMKDGTFSTAAWCNAADVSTGCIGYIAPNMMSQLPLNAAAVATSQDAGFAALLTKTGSVERRQYVIGFPAQPTKIQLAPFAMQPGYVAAAHLSKTQGEQDVIVAAWGGQLALAHGSSATTPIFDADASKALTDGFHAVFGDAARVTGLAFGDLDGDDQMELVVAADKQIYVAPAAFTGFPKFSWNRNASLGRLVQLDSPVSAIAVGDLNSDNKPDIAAYSRSGKKFFAVPTMSPPQR